jgi:hypothetical protein
MPSAFKDLVIATGINTDTTTTGNSPLWYDSDLIRFSNGGVEPFRDWRNDPSLNFAGNYVNIGTLLSPILAYTTQGYQGVLRKLHSWTDNNGVANLFIATEKHLYWYNGTKVQPATPMLDPVTINTNAFTSTAGDNFITVTDTSHGITTTGGYVYFTGAVASGGSPSYDVNGKYWEIIEIINENSYKIYLGGITVVTKAAWGGAATQAYYSLTFPRLTSFGYGIGPYGTGYPYGMSGGSGPIHVLTSWSFSDWGEDVVVGVEGWDLYLFDTSDVLTTNPPLRITNAPQENTGSIVYPDAGVLIVFGANGNLNEISWSDQGNFTNWTTGTSGTQYLYSAGKIKAYCFVNHSVLFWTESGNIYSMRFTGDSTLPFSFNEIGKDSVPFNSYCVISNQTTAYWVHESGLSITDGNSIERLPTTIKTWWKENVTAGLSEYERGKISLGLNKKYKELIVLFPENVNKYVLYNFADQTYAIGYSLPRTAWLEEGAFPYPISGVCDEDTSEKIIIYQHDAYSSESIAAGTSYIRTNWFDLSDGARAILLQRCWPMTEFYNSNTTLNFTFYSRTNRYYSQLLTAESIKGPYVYGVSDSVYPHAFYPRTRGREHAFELSSTSLSSWRYVSSRMEYQLAGKQQ